MEEPARARVDATPPAARRRWRTPAFGTLALELTIVTAGVLIALLVQSLVEWRQHRNLVREARVMIGREIADNKRELETSLAGIEVRRRNLAASLQLADELLTKKKSSIHSLELGMSLADLSAASWHSAERTGAVSYMDYDEVKAYSILYGFQDLFTTRRAQSLERLAAAMTMFDGDPHAAAAKDLEVFRQQVLAMRADLVIEEQLGRRLAEEYQKYLDKMK